MNGQSKPEEINGFSKDGIQYKLWLMPSGKILYQETGKKNEIRSQRFFKAGQESDAAAFFTAKKREVTGERDQVEMIPEDQFNQLALFAA